MMKIYIIAFSILINDVLSCQKSIVENIPEYDSNVIIAPLPDGIVNEASGICDSRSINGHVWIHNDSGNLNELYLFSHQGEYKGALKLPFLNRDWEDISIQTEMKENYLYLADIGDNSAIHEENYIYKFKEPKSVNKLINNYEKITFKYSDGRRDAETILIDPSNKDIYIVSKRELNVHIYKLPFPQRTDKTLTAEFIQTIPLFSITSGGISSDGKEIILRDYGSFFYWYRKANETIAQALARPYDRSYSFVKEPQEEGFCFDQNNKGFFSVGERKNQTKSNFYYFSKK